MTSAIFPGFCQPPGPPPCCTVVKKAFAFVKVCTKVQSSEMTKNLSIFVNQTMEKLDISFCHDPQILKCKNEISFCLD